MTARERADALVYGTNLLRMTEEVEVSRLIAEAIDAAVAEAQAVPVTAWDRVSAAMYRFRVLAKGPTGAALARREALRREIDRAIAEVGEAVDAWLAERGVG